MEGSPLHQSIEPSTLQVEVSPTTSRATTDSPLFGDNAKKSMFAQDSCAKIRPEKARIEAVDQNSTTDTVVVGDAKDMGDQENAIDFRELVREQMALECRPGEIIQPVQQRSPARLSISSTPSSSCDPDETVLGDKEPASEISSRLPFQPFQGIQHLSVGGTKDAGSHTAGPLRKTPAVQQDTPVIGGKRKIDPCNQFFDPQNHDASSKRLCKAQRSSTWHAYPCVEDMTLVNSRRTQAAHSDSAALIRIDLKIQ